MLVLVLVPHLILLNRFIGLLRGALAAERESAERIKAAAKERRRLERVLLETGERERRTVDSFYARMLEKLGAQGMEELRRHAAAHRITP